MIDFWGTGFDVAERMNHRPREFCESLRANEERIRRRNSSTRSWESFLFSLPRGDLAEAIFNVVADKIETVFGDSITAIREDRTGIDVQFEHGHARKFDLLAGCDGLHSAVRELLWGRDKNFVKYLGTIALLSSRRTTRTARRRHTQVTPNQDDRLVATPPRRSHRIPLSFCA